MAKFNYSKYNSLFLSHFFASGKCINSSMHFAQIPIK